MYDFELEIMEKLVDNYEKMTSNIKGNIKYAMQILQDCVDLVSLTGEEFNPENNTSYIEKILKENKFDIFLKKTTPTNKDYKDWMLDNFYGFGWNEEKGIFLNYEGNCRIIESFFLYFNWAPNFLKDREFDSLNDDEKKILSILSYTCKENKTNKIWNCVYDTPMGLNLFFTLFDRYGEFVIPWEIECKYLVDLIRYPYSYGPNKILKMIPLEIRQKTKSC